MSDAANHEASGYEAPLGVVSSSDQATTELSKKVGQLKATTELSGNPGELPDELAMAVETVREWLEIAKKEPVRACQVLRYPPICGSEIDAIDLILSRLASQEARNDEMVKMLIARNARIMSLLGVNKSQEETIRADREFVRAIASERVGMGDADHERCRYRVWIDAARVRLSARQEGRDHD